ncbi:unnamed protein product [Urochloa humidicola]
MAPRLLLLQLCAAAASCLWLLAAGYPIDAAPCEPPSRDVVPAGTAAVAPAPAAGVVNDVATSAAPDDGVAAVFRAARRLGPPHRLRALSDIPADAPADDYDYDIAADAPAPAAGDGDIATSAPAPAPAPAPGNTGG